MRLQHLCIGAFSVAMSTAAVNAMLPPPGVVAVNVNFASTLKLDGTAWDLTVAPLHYTGKMAVNCASAVGTYAERNLRGVLKDSGTFSFSRAGLTT